MDNPLAQHVDIPFRGGSVRCRLDLAAILAAETETNIPIISPSDSPFGERTMLVQMTCYLYALIYSSGMKATLDDIRAMLVGPKAAYIYEQIEKIMPSFQAHLEAYYKQFDKKAAANGGETPLADGLGGPNNGPTLLSSSESVASSSGRLRRAK